MLEMYLKWLNYDKVIKDSMPKLIEVFTEYYGSSCEEKIRERFNNVFIAPFTRPDDLRYLLSNIERELTDKLIKEIGCSEDENKMYFSNVLFNNFKSFPINAYRNFLKYAYMSEEELIVDKRKKGISIFKKYFPNVTVENMPKIKETPNYKLIMSDDRYVGLRSTWNYFLDDSVENQDFINAKKGAVKFLKNKYPEVTEDNILELEKSGGFDREKETLSKIEQKLEEYNSFMTSLQKYFNIVNKAKQLEEEIKENNKIKFIKRFESYFGKNNVDEYIEALSYEKKYNAALKVVIEYENSDQSEMSNEVQEAKKIIYDASVKKYVEFVQKSGFNEFFLHFSILNSFDSESYKILDGDDSFKKSTVLFNRVLYFKNRGLKLGDDYGNYENNLEAKKLIPDPKLVDEMIAYKEELDKSLKAEIYVNMPQYKEVINELNSLGLYSHSYGYDPNLFEYTPGAIIPNIKMDGGEVLVSPILYIRGGKFEKEIDNVLVHELNHLFELTFVKMDGDYQVHTCGWDNVLQEKESEDSIGTIGDKKNDKRDYELFNEIINEIIAQEITCMMHEKGIYILNSKEYAKIGNHCTYEMLSPLVSHFFNEFKSEILVSRRDNNIEAIWDRVGKDNFDKLNELIKEYDKYFRSHYTPITMESKCRLANYDLEQGRDTMDTRFLRELYERRDKVINNMKNYTSNLSM